MITSTDAAQIFIKSSFLRHNKCSSLRHICLKKKKSLTWLKKQRAKEHSARKLSHMWCSYAVFRILVRHDLARDTMGKLDKARSFLLRSCAFPGRDLSSIYRRLMLWISMPQTPARSFRGAHAIKFNRPYRQRRVCKAVRKHTLIYSLVRTPWKIHRSPFTHRGMELTTINIYCAYTC